MGLPYLTVSPRPRLSLRPILLILSLRPILLIGSLRPRLFILSLRPTLSMRPRLLILSVWPKLFVLSLGVMAPMLFGCVMAPPRLLILLELPMLAMLFRLLQLLLALNVPFVLPDDLPAGINRYSETVVLGLVYTDHHRQCCELASNIALIKLLRFLNKPAKSFQKWDVTPNGQI